MRAGLVPVKAFAAAKTRLAPYLSPEARASLAEALVRDFFAVLEQVRGLDRVYVASNEPLALEWAKKRGWITIVEAKQISESHSVDAASRICAEDGVGTLLRLPADVPLAEAEDIEVILAAAASAPAMVIVPSADGTGTNALLRSPPTLFPSHFGTGSFARHMGEAERCGASVKILDLPRLGLDIDEPADLRALSLRLTRVSATSDWLRAHGF